MRRVYAIWFLRRIGPVLCLEMPLLLIIALRETAREFFVAKILENFAAANAVGGFSGIVNFIGSALYSAPLLPVAIIGFSAGLFLILAYRLARNFQQLTLVRI